MSREHWLPSLEVPCEFAGSIHYTRVDIVLRLENMGPCCHCPFEKQNGPKIKAKIRAVLNKSRKPASYYAQRTIVPLVLKMCRDGKHLCNDCIRFLPLSADPKSS